MIPLAVHQTTTATKMADLLQPASAAGNEFRYWRGGALLVAANKLKRRARTINLRIDYGDRVDEVTQSVKAGTECIFGPFGLEMGPLGFEMTAGEPITVKLTYPKSRGLRVCAVKVPDVSLEESA